MTEEQQLKLQGFLDGELPENEARSVASWLARDADATALMGELRNTRKTLADFEPRLTVPETREFYWSKIERQIQRLERVPPPTESVPMWSIIRRWLAPVGAAAALAVIAVVMGLHLEQSALPGHAEVVMAVADPGTFTYHDYANGTTLVWLTYPAERELAKDAVH